MRLNGCGGMFAVLAMLAGVRAAAAAPALDSPPIDLLNAVSTVVAVSSTVANKAIVPAHLVDGRLDTAWNSKTGQLVGASISVRTPAFVRVSTIRMTVGFTKIDKQADLFTMNPRITKVRVFRNGALLREQALDPAVRTLQDVAIEADGGDFKIEIAEVLAGSKKNWREVSVSELEILGRLPADHTTTLARPYVKVGPLDSPNWRPKGPALLDSAPPFLVALPTEAAVALVLGDGPPTFTAGGALVILDRRPTKKPNELSVVAMQPIVATPAQRTAWIGKPVQLHAAAGPACTGTITALAVVVENLLPATTTPTTATFLAAWPAKQPRHWNGTLVAVVTPASGARCKGALWAADPGVPTVRGKLEPRRHHKPLLDRFLAKGGGYEQLREAYVLNDLNGEYENADANEKQLPPDERLTERLVRKSFETVAGCHGERCVGVVHGEFSSYATFVAMPIAAGVVGASSPVCAGQPDEVLAVADADGDGAVDLVFSARSADSGAPERGIVLHGGRSGSVSLRGRACFSR